MSQMKHIPEQDLQSQVINQYQAVAHMASCLSGVGTGMAHFADGLPRDHLEDLFESSLDLMNQLGDILNDMDAVAEKDHWVSLVFEKADGMRPPK